MTLTSIKGTPDRRGNWMQTYSGGEIYPIDPLPEEIDIRDIAGALSKMCRYGGHCLRFYSVAEHCVLLSRKIDEPHKLAALMHDASEAYLVDIPRPIKPFLQNYAEIEDNLMQAIALKFGFQWPMADAIRDIDTRVLADERNQAMAPPPRDWGVGEPIGITLEFWSPERAESEYLAQFMRLSKYDLG